jgi:hypothetical protein
MIDGLAYFVFASMTTKKVFKMLTTEQPKYATDFHGKHTEQVSLLIFNFLLLR